MGRMVLGGASAVCPVLLIARCSLHGCCVLAALSLGRDANWIQKKLASVRLLEIIRCSWGMTHVVYDHTVQPRRESRVIPMRRGVSIPAHVRPIRIALPTFASQRTLHRGMRRVPLRTQKPRPAEVVWMGSMKRPAPTKTSASSAMPTPMSKTRWLKPSAEWLSGGDLQRCWIMPQAAPSIGQARPNQPLGPRWAATEALVSTRARADDEGLLLLVTRFDLDELLAHGRLDARGVAVEDAVDPPG